MRSSRLIFAGALTLALAAAVWHFASPDSTGDRSAPVATDSNRGAPSSDTPRDAHAFAGNRGEGSSQASVSSEAPANGISAFARRQDLERNGYEAGKAGHSVALQRLAAIAAPGERAAFIRGMLAGLRETGASEVIEAIRRIKDPYERLGALRALAEARQFEAPIAKSITGTPKTADPIRHSMERLMRTMEFTNAPVFSDSSLLIMSLADSPELAAGLAKELTKGAEQGALLAEIARDLVKQNPTKALALGESLQGKVREDFLARVVSGWGLADPAAAWAWASARNEPALQEAVLEGIAPVNPKAAAQNVAQMNAGEPRDRVLKRLGEVWGGKDTAEALEWANALPTQQERDDALASVRKSAPVGIGAMLSTDPDGYLLIQDLVPGGAASEIPQLAKGSRITGIRDASGKLMDLQGVKLVEAISQLRGAPGTTVTLEVIPPGGSANDRRTVVVTRRQVIRKG